MANYPSLSDVEYSKEDQQALANLLTLTRAEALRMIEAHNQECADEKRNADRWFLQENQYGTFITQLVSFGGRGSTSFPPAPTDYDTTFFEFGYHYKVEG